MIQSTEIKASGTSDADWERVSALVCEALAGRGYHVPSQAMLDFAYGGLDEELLSTLHEDHLNACATCRRAVEVYRTLRPDDPARFFEVPDFADTLQDREGYELSPAVAGRKLRDFIAGGSGRLLVVAGEANPEVYDWELGEVLCDRVRRSRREGDNVPKFICGPAMGLNHRIATAQDTVLPQLAEQGFVELFISTHRQRFHFRVSGESSVYTEGYHRAGNAADRQGYWYESRSIAAMLNRRFQALIAAGKARPARRDDFVYLPMDTIRTIELSSEINFDLMTARDLASWLDGQSSGTASSNDSQVGGAT